MLTNPGPWFVSPNNELTVISLLPPQGESSRHPSQYPLRSLRGYPVASRFTSEVAARAVCIFPDLVRLVDAIIKMDDERIDSASRSPSDDHQQLGEQMARLVTAAQRCRDYLGTTAEMPTSIKVMSNKYEQALPTFSKPHLDRLETVGLVDQVALFRYWQDNVDPFRGIIL